MDKTKAGFRALRERLGMRQIDVADECGVVLATVKKWERPGFMAPPDDAWNALIAHEADALRIIDASVSAVASAGATGDVDGKRVVMTYYRDQAHYDKHGRDQGLYGMANAIARRVADALEDMGAEVSWRYPEESGNPYHESKRAGAPEIEVSL